MGVYFAHTGVDVSCVLRRFGICSLERAVVLVVFVLRGSSIMGRHLSPQELDQWLGMTPRLVLLRAVAGDDPAAGCIAHRSCSSPCAAHAV